MILSLNMIQTLAAAVVVLYAGMFLKSRIRVFERFCIPAPVIGGVLFSLIALAGYMSGAFQFSFDMTLKDVCMTGFFTSVGFGASLKPLKAGGKQIGIFVGLVVLLVLLQNLVAVVLSPVVGVEPLLGMCTGSIPMIGGHGSAGAFGPVLKAAGVESATSVAMAAATFGLVGGSLIGGPLGKRLIEKYDLSSAVQKRAEEQREEKVQEAKHILEGYLAKGVYQLVLAMGVGTFVSWLLSFTGLEFPAYIGAMLAAAVIRNVGDLTGAYTIYELEISEVGSVMLSLFLSMALMALNLWELAALAVPMIVLLLAQAALMAVFAYFVVFRALGKDYDAAIMVSGACGFGMGATPNAMANMQALTDKYLPSPKSFLIVPVVGSLFVDFINSIAITLFINMLR